MKFDLQKPLLREQESACALWMGALHKEGTGGAKPQARAQQDVKTLRASPGLHRSPPKSSMTSLTTRTVCLLGHLDQYNLYY